MEYIYLGKEEDEGIRKQVSEKAASKINAVHSAWLF